jgi:hypothetical protein
MRNPDRWLRQQIWQLLWQGPGAVSAYWSIPVPLVCTALSLSGPPGLAGATCCILLVNLLLGVLLILVDEIGSCRNHDLGAIAFVRCEEPRSYRETWDQIRAG